MRVVENRVEHTLRESELVQHQVSHIVIARELTKMHEEVVAGTVAEVQAHFTAHGDRVRGEFVVIVVP